MFDFRPNPDQTMLIETVKRYSDERVNKQFREAEESGHIDPELIQQGWDIGLLQTAIPEDYNGFGDHSAVTGVLGLEQFAQGDLGITFQLMVPNLFAIPLLLCGTPEQKAAHLPAFTGGTPPAYTAALIEPSYQFDPRQLTTTAVVDGDKIRLTGQKMMVPNADSADYLLVYGRLNDQTKAFIVPRDSAGLTIGPAIA